jgi:hypothetical protein
MRSKGRCNEVETASQRVLDARNVSFVELARFALPEWLLRLQQLVGWTAQASCAGLKHMNLEVWIQLCTNCMST